MRGDEARVVEAFVRHLEQDGWSVEREVGYVDVTAVRGDVTLFAEAKGRTSSIGLDVDTMYGQLLRRLPEEPVARMRLAVVVPERAVAAALRVHSWVRDRLAIDVYAVSDEDEVRLVATAAPSP